MTKKFKWQIKELKYSKQLCKKADVILKNRIGFLIEKVNQYLTNKSVENLHELRIALRRVRYPMEVFFVCYNKKTFIKFYNKIQKLQDLSGTVRDIDITIDHFHEFIGNQKSTEGETFLLKIIDKKNELQKNFDVELNSFINSKILKDFYTQKF